MFKFVPVLSCESFIPYIKHVLLLYPACFSHKQISFLEDNLNSCCFFASYQKKGLFVHLCIKSSYTSSSLKIQDCPNISSRSVVIKLWIFMHLWEI